MIKKQMTDILLSAALCILTASVLTGCAANGKNNASGVQESPSASQGQAENPAAGNTAAADTGNKADGKALPEPVLLPIITVPPEHLPPPHHPPTAPKPLWKARRAAQTQKS